MLLQLDITARSPLAFAQTKPGSQFRESLPYVPGATIYGALGRLLGDQGAFAADLVERLRCHNAYPARPGDRWVRPLPATAIQPKGVDDVPPKDALVELVCWEQQQPPALIYAPTDSEGRAWETAEWRFYTIDASSQLAQRSVTQRVLTRVAINRRRGTAEDQRLYSPLVLAEASREHSGDTFEDTQFRGSILVPDSDATVRSLIEQIGQVGGRQSTGLGAVAVKATESQPELAASVQARVERLTEQFQAQELIYQQLGGKGWERSPGEGPIFTVNLLSDAILLEDGWLPTNQLSANVLAALTRIKATLVRAFATTSTAGGWNVSWQRPKPTALATAMGSLFVFQAAAPLTQEQYARLAALQYQGIGERRQEGYGQIRICDEFHLTQEAA
jgi:CRISPR-associated protein Csx10